MLVLTRKSGEAINVGDEITVTVLEVRGNQVRLGIQAPHNVIIHRKELYEKIKSENLRSLGLSIDDFKKIREGLR
ncbi:MAG TPA: carbon storage regulator CsrA [Syntrophorhabdales bacterium]|nr:carbon storage regulator CsrA [Syntrophorhabdales bacterium]